MGEFKDITIRFKGDSTELSKELGKINDSMRGTTRDLHDVDRLLRFKEGAGSIDILNQKIELSSKRVEEWKQRVETLSDAQHQLELDGDTTSEKYAAVTTALQKAQVQLEHYTEELRQAQIAYDKHATSLGRFGQSLKDTGASLKTVGQSMQATGATLTTSVTMPMIAMGAATVHSATEVDSALTDVRKTVDGTAKDYERLRKAAIESSNVQPVDAATLLEIEALGGQLGFTLDELQEFSRVASGLDVSTNMGWEQASTEMAQFFNIMDLNHDEISNYASAIVALGNNFSTTESDVSAMAQRIAGAGKQLGLSASDVLGLSAALTSMGISAEAGGTAISTIMSNIDKDVALGSDNVAKWGSVVGQSASEFSASWNADVIGTLTNVLTHMESVDEEGGNLSVLLEDLGISAIRQTDTMKRLAGNTDLVTDAISMANEAYAQDIALQREVDNKNESRAAKLQVIANRFTNIASEVGGPVTDALLEAADAAEPILQRVGDMAHAFTEMDEAQQKTILKYALMAAAAGPLLTVTGKLTSGVGTLVEGLGSGIQTFAAFSGQLKQGASLTEAFTSTVTGGATALAGLKALAIGAAIGVVVYGVVSLVKELNHAVKATDDFNAAIDNLGSYAEAGASGLTSYRSAIGMTSTEAMRLTTSTEGLTEMLEDHNDSMREIESSSRTTSEQLQRYRDVIDELGGKGAATTDEHAKLKWALDGLNEALGTSITEEEVLTGKYEDENGEIQNTIDMLDKLIETRQREARTQADESLYEEALKNEEHLQSTLSDSKKAFEEYAKLRRESLRSVDGWADKTEDELDDFLRHHDKTFAELEQNYWRAEHAAEEASDETQQAFQRMANDQSIMAAGMNIEEFQQAMREAGLTSNDLANISTEDFAKMLSSCGGDIDELVAMIGDYNRLQMEDKEPRIEAWGNVVDGEAEDAVRRLIQQMKDLRDKTVTVTYKTYNAPANAPTENTPMTAAHGVAIQRYATGVIATGPTAASVGGRPAIIGEAGHEALVSAGRNNYVVPLNNKYYSQPFIDDVAEGVGKYMGRTGLAQQQGNTYIIDRLEYLPGSAVAEHVDAIFREVLVEEG